MFELAQRNGVALPYRVGRGGARGLRVRRPAVLPRHLLRGRRGAADASRTSTTSPGPTSSAPPPTACVHAEIFFDPRRTPTAASRSRPYRRADRRRAATWRAAELRHHRRPDPVLPAPPRPKTRRWRRSSRRCRTGTASSAWGSTPRSAATRRRSSRAVFAARREPRAS